MDCAEDVSPPPDFASASVSSTRSAVKRSCRFGDECRKLDDEAHCEQFGHPSKGDAEVSKDGEQHAGTRFPRRQCRSHPGCPRRNDCWYSHGLIKSVTTALPESGALICFLSQAPHNKDCSQPTWNGDPYEFCSNDCRELAKKTPKGPMGCRREDCPCPVTITGIAGQFCCDACAAGSSCQTAVHTLPSMHLVVVATPQPGKYAPCTRPDCACAVAEGSSWDGNPGQYCSRVCRNGTPCTKLWHTSPESVAEATTESQYVSYECALDECTLPTWNGRKGEYCCIMHRRIGLGNMEAADACAAVRSSVSSLDSDVELPVDASGEPVEPAEPDKFPNYKALWKNVRSWTKSHGGGASKGKLSGLWFNESLKAEDCPARLAFEQAVEIGKPEGWSDGEFGWHGTKAVSFVEAICWLNWDTSRRSGQAFGPGEYFSRGTKAGLHYSEGYSGGDAGHLLIVAWIMSHTKGGAPKDPKKNGAGAGSGFMGGPGSGHIVCCNPTTASRKTTGVMYCLPVAVASFGIGGRKPRFRLNPDGELNSYPSGEIINKSTIAKSSVCHIL